MFVNMDEDAVCFEARSKSIVHHTGAPTVSVRGSPSSNHRLTACILVAYDGTKLFLFLMFKEKSNERIER